MNRNVSFRAARGIDSAKALSFVKIDIQPKPLSDHTGSKKSNRRRVVNAAGRCRNAYDGPRSLAERYRSIARTRPKLLDSDPEWRGFFFLKTEAQPSLSA